MIAGSIVLTGMVSIHAQSRLMVHPIETAERRLVAPTPIIFMSSKQPGPLHYILLNISVYL